MTNYPPVNSGKVPFINPIVKKPRILPNDQPNNWIGIRGKPYITVSAKGLKNGLSDIENDGADFGPDSYINGDPNQGLTQTSGIQEAVNYSYVSQSGASQPVMLLGRGIQFTVSATINMPYTAAIGGQLPNIYGSDRRATYVVFTGGDGIVYPSTYNEDLEMWNVELSNQGATNIFTYQGNNGDIHFWACNFSGSAGFTGVFNITGTNAQIFFMDSYLQGDVGASFGNNRVFFIGGRWASGTVSTSSIGWVFAFHMFSFNPTIQAGSNVYSRYVYNSVDQLPTPTLTPNPPVSGTAYQNTNPYDILIYLPVYTSTSGTAGNIKASIGPTSTPATQVVNDIVNSGTTSSNPRTIILKVPARWYYEFTGTTTTFGTAIAVAD